MLICESLGLQALEIYTRDAAAVSVEHSEEANLDMPRMLFFQDRWYRGNRKSFCNRQTISVEC